MTMPHETFAIAGGTGELGSALARRLVAAGCDVVLGSRDAARAAAAAERLHSLVAPAGRLRSASNAQAAALATCIIVTVPFESQAAVLEDIKPQVAGKLVVDCTVPLVPPKVMRVQLPEPGCAALRAQRILGAGVTVCSAFHNVAAHKLAADGKVDCDVLVFGDERAARERVIAIVEHCGLRGLHGGALANSAAAEALTSVLIFINKHYSVDGAGIRITGP
ncbi:MAG: NADPH-dependent F420 reductase [Steroidobacteraceae bacterium]|nr:NADPH-dependent F420 reductase [Steroidobacteraceae bacterium]MDW8258353.1 NADPH-dependent F420 reductase [Gammaproteobacteria bacterium]